MIHSFARLISNLIFFMGNGQWTLDMDTPSCRLLFWLEIFLTKSIGKWWNMENVVWSLIPNYMENRNPMEINLNVRRNTWPWCSSIRIASVIFFSNTTYIWSYIYMYLIGITLATLIRAINLRKLLQMDGLTKKKLYGILLSMKFRIMDTWMIKKANDLHKTAILSKWIWIIRLLLSSCTLSFRTHSVLVTIVHLFVSQHNNGTLTHTTTNYNCKQENSKQLSLIQGFARYYFKIPIILFIRFSDFPYAHVASISIRTDLLCFFGYVCYSRFVTNL